MGLANRWTSHIKDDAEKVQFERRIVANYDLFKRLRELIKEDLESSSRKVVKEDNYSLPAWPYYQADQIGYQRALSKVLEILPTGEK